MVVISSNIQQHGGDPRLYVETRQTNSSNEFKGPDLWINCQGEVCKNVLHYVLERLYGFVMLDPGIEDVQDWFPLLTVHEISKLIRFLQRQGCIETLQTDNQARGHSMHFPASSPVFE